MFPVKRILCPVDFSKPSLTALKASCELAGQFSAELILIHVVQPAQPVAAPGIPAGYMIEGYYEERALAAHQSFEEIRAEKVPDGVPVRTKVVQGQPADEIVREAESEKADIIVIATHGWTGWRRFIFGSVAEKVVRLSSCPVLTIPGPGKSH